MFIKNIIFFMVFVSMLIGIINYMGIGDVIVMFLLLFVGLLWGLIVIVFVCILLFFFFVLGFGVVIV